MWKFAKVIVQNGSLVLFVILQSICLIWIVRYNQPQRKIYLHSYQLLATSFQAKVNSTIDYFSLKSRYDSLAHENANLLVKLANNAIKNNNDEDTLSRSGKSSPEFHIIAARVINNSLDKRNNTITLDKGGKHGITPGMGVITTKGIVGIVSDTSSNYSLVLSVLHEGTSISSRLKRCGFFGPLVWEGRDPSMMQLQAIQKYADVRLGDTVVTSGYSVIFPKNMLIGTVALYRIDQGSFTYEIDVKLSQPMTNIDQVYVIVNENKQEKLDLEQKISRYE
ncbi:MAG: rod shape-determining protein MreC [Saprospiraceae bacterium]|nr:rod shape-determining protein MreC [Saprospiraceae bacterium]